MTVGLSFRPLPAILVAVLWPGHCCAHTFSQEKKCQKSFEFESEAAAIPQFLPGNGNIPYI
jgi:hypothetical protein